MLLKGDGSGSAITVSTSDGKVRHKHQVKINRHANWRVARVGIVGSRVKGGAPTYMREDGLITIRSVRFDTSVFKLGGVCGP